MKIPTRDSKYAINLQIFKAQYAAAAGDKKPHSPNSGSTSPALLIKRNSWRAACKFSTTTAASNNNSSSCNKSKSSNNLTADYHLVKASHNKKRSPSHSPARRKANGTETNSQKSAPNKPSANTDFGCSPLTSRRHSQNTPSDYLCKFLSNIKQFGQRLIKNNFYHNFLLILDY